MLKSRLDLWKTKGKHAAYPDNILIYRDGVSEGQYDIVLNQELPLLREACKEKYPATQTKAGLPRLTIVVVGKRHHTRFYPAQDNDADNKSNCKPGTVVDRGVTEARNWDFFLQAHSAIQGSARPAHYFVVLDEIFRSRKAIPAGNLQDSLEQITQSLCYVYGRATRAVSICTPAYYADIVCERARSYLKNLYDPSASDAGSVAAGGGAAVVNLASSVRVHPNLTNTMFYI